MPDRPVVYFLCTGNAARSVMATAMLRARSDTIEVRSGGSHTIEGLPMSVRTRTALARHDLRDPFHRSHQLTGADVADADLIVAMEPLHVTWVRENHGHGAPITATLRRLVRALEPGPGAAGLDSLTARVVALGLESVEAEPWEEVVDPASGQQPEFDRCADELMKLVAGLHRALE